MEQIQSLQQIHRHHWCDSDRVLLILDVFMGNFIIQQTLVYKHPYVLHLEIGDIWILERGVQNENGVIIKQTSNNNKKLKMYGKLKRSCKTEESTIVSLVIYLAVDLYFD